MSLLPYVEPCLTPGSPGGVTHELGIPRASEQDPVGGPRHVSSLVLLEVVPAPAMPGHTLALPRHSLLVAVGFVCQPKSLFAGLQLGLIAFMCRKVKVPGVLDAGRIATVNASGSLSTD